MLLLLELLFTGDVLLSGNVDGRNVATDGAKLDGVSTGADVTSAALNAVNRFKYRNKFIGF